MKKIKHIRLNNLLKFAQRSYTPERLQSKLPQWPNFRDQLLLENIYDQSSRHGSGETNLTSIHEDVGSIPGLAQWAKDLALP